MSAARRVLLVVALAAIAVVPLRAFGVVGGDSASGLSVDASLGGCGVSGTEILCEIQIAFDGIEGADHYTASVTRADGSVQDAGTVGTGEDGGSATIYVPYVGAGTYSVTVSAWGADEDGDDEPELLERDRAGAGSDRDGDRGRASAEPADAEAPEAGADELAPTESTEPSTETAPAPPETQTLPECQPEEAETEAAEAEAAAEQAEVEASAAPPEPPPAPAIECATPSSDSNGPCCPPSA